MRRKDREIKDIVFTETQVDSVCVFKIVSRDYTAKQKNKI